MTRIALLLYALWRGLFLVIAAVGYVLGYTVGVIVGAIVAGYGAGRS